MSNRKTAVHTAQCWHDAAMNYNAPWNERFMCALNAFNHTENALFALADKVVSCAGGAGDNELLEMAQHFASGRPDLGTSEPKPYGCTQGHCVFSRRLDQEYPRKCTKCGATEQLSVNGGPPDV